MLKFKFVDPEENAKENDIAWVNLENCDKYFQLDFFLGAVMGWLNVNPDKTFQDLEFELRKRDLNTHLFAKKVVLDPDFSLVLNNQKDLKYECVFSCKPKNLALKEVLQHWPTYEDNFDALKYSGSLTLNKTITTSYGTVRLFDKSCKTNIDFLSQNEKIIQFTYENQNIIIETINQNCIKKFGKSPELKVFKTSKEGIKIYAFMIDGDVIEDIGIIKDKNNKKLLFVSLKNDL